jgi:hypothetical protein
MLNFGHRHLQIGQMLDIDLITDLRSKGVKGWTFSKTKITDRALYSTLIFAQVEDPTVLPSTIDLCLYICLYNVRGWGEFPVYLNRMTMDRDSETLKYDLETGANSQTPDASHPPPPPPQGKGDVRAQIFKLLRGPGINSKELITPAYEARRAGITTLFLIGS